MKRRSTYEAPRWDQVTHRSARILCLFHAHKWGRRSMFSILGYQAMYESCDRCGLMRPAVS